MPGIPADTFYPVEEHLQGLDPDDLAIIPQTLYNNRPVAKIAAAIEQGRFTREGDASARDAAANGEDLESSRGSEFVIEIKRDGRPAFGAGSDELGENSIWKGILAKRKQSESALDHVNKKKAKELAASHMETNYYQPKGSRVDSHVDEKYLEMLVKNAKMSIKADERENNAIRIVRRNPKVVKIQDGE